MADGKSQTLPLIGHPTKLTLERQQRAVEVLEHGNYETIAANAIGVSDTTWVNWKARGRKETERLAADPDAIPLVREAPFVAFLAAITRAQAVAEEKLIELWAGHAAEDWRAAKELLARRRPDRWAARQAVAVDVTSKGEAVGGGLTVEQALAIVAAGPPHPEDGENGDG